MPPPSVPEQAASPVGARMGCRRGGPRRLCGSGWSQKLCAWCLCVLHTVARDGRAMNVVFTAHLVVVGGIQYSAIGGRDRHSMTRHAVKGVVL